MGLLWCGLALLGGSSALFGASRHSLWVMSVARVGQGLGSAAGANGASAFSAVVFSAEPAHAALAASVLDGVSGVGFMLGPVLGALLFATVTHGTSSRVRRTRSWAHGLMCLGRLQMAVFGECRPGVCAVRVSPAPHPLVSPTSSRAGNGSRLPTTPVVI